MAGQVVRRWVMLSMLVAALLPWPAQAQEADPYTLESTLGRGLVRSGAWSPDGSLIAVGGGVGIWLYTPDFEDVGRLTGHERAAYGVAFSPDGSRLASASHDMTVRLWDLATQQEERTLFGHEGLVVAVAWSPDGTAIASGAYDSTLRLWDAATGALRHTSEHAGWVQQVAYSPDGSQVVSSGHDGTIHLWEARTGAPLSALPSSAEAWAELTGQHPESFFGPRAASLQRAWSPDGSRVLVVDWQGAPRIVDAATLQVVATQDEHTDWITAVTWDDSGSRIISMSADGLRRTWDVRRGSLVDTTPGGPDTGAPDRAEAPGGGREARIDAGGIVQIVDVVADEIIAVLPGRANAVAWSPDGRRLAVAARNGTIQIWGASIDS